MVLLQQMLERVHMNAEIREKKLEYDLKRVRCRKKKERTPMNKANERILNLREALKPLRRQLEYISSQRCNAPRYDFPNI
jgi:hypothetical protein